MKCVKQNRYIALVYGIPDEGYWKLRKPIPDILEITRYRLRLLQEALQERRQPEVLTDIAMLTRNYNSHEVFAWSPTTQILLHNFNALEYLMQIFSREGRIIQGMLCGLVRRAMFTRLPLPSTEQLQKMFDKEIYQQACAPGATEREKIKCSWFGSIRNISRGQQFFKSRDRVKRLATVVKTLDETFKGVFFAAQLKNDSPEVWQFVKHLLS